MKSLTSLELRPIVAELEAACLDAGKALGDAEHVHRLTVRKAVLSGDYGAPDRTAESCCQRPAPAVSAVSSASPSTPYPA